MDTVITALTGASGFTAADFYAPMASAVPFLKILVPVALGLAIVRKLIKGAGKGKVKI